jgi:hypothetical protein
MSFYFKIHENSFRLVKPENRLLTKLIDKFMDERVFTQRIGVQASLREEPDLFVFDNFIEGYHLLMLELSDLAVESANLVISDCDTTENIYITGGFSKNLLFLKMIASSFPDKSVWISEINNATALGAALVILKTILPGNDIEPELGLSEVRI